jgi:hypothetical protein
MKCSKEMHCLLRENLKAETTKSGAYASSVQKYHLHGFEVRMGYQESFLFLFLQQRSSL